MLCLKRKKIGDGNSVTPIEDLFNAISEGDLTKVEDSIRRGASMRIRMDGMYPIQRAFLADAMVDERDPKKIGIRKILASIEEKSKKVGLEYEEGNLVDKKDRADAERSVRKAIGQKRRGDSPGR